MLSVKNLIARLILVRKGDFLKYMTTVFDARLKLSKLPDSHEKDNLALALDLVAMDLVDQVGDPACFVYINEAGQKVPDPELAAKTLKRIEG